MKEIGCHLGYPEFFSLFEDEGFDEALKLGIFVGHIEAAHPFERIHPVLIDGGPIPQVSGKKVAAIGTEPHTLGLIAGWQFSNSVDSRIDPFEFNLGDSPFCQPDDLGVISFSPEPNGAGIGW